MVYFYGYILILSVHGHLVFHIVYFFITCLVVFCIVDFDIAAIDVDDAVDVVVVAVKIKSFRIRWIIHSYGFYYHIRRFGVNFNRTWILYEVRWGQIQLHTQTQAKKKDKNVRILFFFVCHPYAC